MSLFLPSLGDSFSHFSYYLSKSGRGGGQSCKGRLDGVVSPRVAFSLQFHRKLGLTQSKRSGNAQSIEEKNEKKGEKIENCHDKA